MTAFLPTTWQHTRDRLSVPAAVLFALVVGALAWWGVLELLSVFW